MGGEQGGGLLDQFNKPFDELANQDKINKDFVLKQLSEYLEFLNQVEYLLQKFLEKQQTEELTTEKPQTEELTADIKILLNFYKETINTPITLNASINSTDFNSAIKSTIQQLQDIVTPSSTSNSETTQQKVKSTIASVKKSQTEAEKLQLMIRQAGHRLGLADEDYTDKSIFSKTHSYAKERSFDRDSLQWIKESTKNYVDTPGNNATETAHDFMNVIDQAAKRLDKPPTIQAFQIADQIIAGKPVMIPSGWSIIDGSGQNNGTHSISIAICPSPDGTIKVIYSNRGDRRSGDDASNLRIYEFDKQLLENKGELTKQIQNLLFLSGRHDQHPQATVDKALSKIVVPGSQREAKYNPSDQKQNTCGHANKKPIYFGMLEAANPNATREELLKEYKKFTTNLRRAEIATLAKDCDNTNLEKQQIAKELLTAAIIKFANKLKDPNNLLGDPKHIRSVALLVELKELLKDKGNIYQDICGNLPEHVQKVMKQIDSQDFKKTLGPSPPTGGTGTYDQIMDQYFTKLSKSTLEEKPQQPSST